MEIKNFKIGDKVYLEDEKVFGNVVEIINDKEKMKEWNLKEKGLMISSKDFSLVFYPIEFINKVNKIKSKQNIKS